MILDILRLDSLLGGTADAIANISGINRKLLEWRLSPEARKYYTDEENKEFYAALKKGDLKVIDAIRLEKQQRIDNYLNKRKVSKK